MSALRFLVILVFSAVALASAQAAPEKRIALIIGNSKYQALPPLSNPANDAKLMEKTLKSVGFETLTVIDASRQQVVKAMKAFSEMVTPDSSVVVYYAGHGIQFDSDNYLIPVDSDITDSTSLPFEAFSMKVVTDQVTRIRPKITILIVDACRNNPLEKNRSAGGAADDGASRGLARVTGPLGSFVAFATAPGQVASDGKGKNSPFATALADVITTPGLPIEQVFKRVRERVVEVTGGKQQPWDNSSLIKDFFFKDALAEQPTFSSEATQDAQAWQVATAADTMDAYSTYRSAFPQGLFSDIAETRIEALDPNTEKTEVAAAVVEPVPANRAIGAADDLLSWNNIAQSSKAEDYRTYLEKYPDGVFSKLARLKMEDLTKSGLEVSSLDSKVSPKFVEFEENPLYPEITDCDRLAGHVQEIADPAVGVYFRQIVPDKAVPACLTALKQYPDSMRILINYGRAIDASGRHDEAREIYRTGAAVGFPIALRSLGDVYRDGRGVEKNLNEARYYYVLGAAKDSVFAEYNLAQIYEKGNGVPVDANKAVYWYWRAARQGFAPAMEALAGYYQRGEVVKKDMAQAKILLEGCAEMGNAGAQQQLGELLISGEAGSKNEKGGRAWVEKSALQGNQWAQAKLGTLYLDGVGGKKDPKEALNWLVLAQKGGADYVASIIPDLEKKLGKKAKARAVDFAENFKPKS
ncbi:caspase family protein [Pararhizobium sp.]|uniref:caspase family protein n=1 Tax=Pararhizobium sp. TaxID=1977563 RepID=UPI00271D6E99|nr:caspase family protein [Pararhizobium sp.]MDO9416199.1 caspase family protein [Pararhizobium sp.]